MILKNGKRIDGCSDTVPIGTLNPYIGTTPPFGYLICEGQLVSKTTYPELYAICGDTFGTATATEFYLPDLRGQTIAGYKQGDSDFGTLGALIGSKYLQEHRHNAVIRTGEGSQGQYGLAYQTGLTGSYDGYINNAGTGNSGNIQPTMVLNWIVKAIMLMPNQSTVSTIETNSDLNTYSCNYVNSLAPKYIRVNQTADQVFNTTNSVKVIFNSTSFAKGFRLSDNTVQVVDSDIHHVRVTFTGWFERDTSYVWISLYKNDSTKFGTYMLANNNNGEDWQSVNITAICDVQQNDAISVYAYFNVASADNKSRGGTYVTSTYLTVEKID